MEGKRLELLKEAVPRLSRVVVLANPANPLGRVNLDIARQAADKLAVKIEIVEARSAANVDDALAQIKESRPDAVLIASDTQLLSKRKDRANFMAEQHLPAIYPLGNSWRSEACSFMEPILPSCSNRPQIIWTRF